MKAMNKLKKMKKKVKDKLKRKARPRPWDHPDRAGRIVDRRASIFGTINSTNEHRQHYMGYSSLARNYRFNGPHHFKKNQVRQQKKANAQASKERKAPNPGRSKYSTLSTRRKSSGRRTR